MANKTKRIDLRVTPAELESIEALARETEKTKSAYLLGLVEKDALSKPKASPGCDGTRNKDAE